MQDVKRLCTENAQLKSQEYVSDIGLGEEELIREQILQTEAKWK